MARMGLEEETIMMLGRWRSTSWKQYAKSGRGIRRAELQRITSMVMSSMWEQSASPEFVESEYEVHW